MAARSGIFVPEKEIAVWREEDASIERQISELNQRRSEIRRKLDAVDILAASAAEAAEEKEEKDSVEATPANGSGEGSGSPAFDLVSNLRKTGDSLKVQQVRQRLIDLNHEDKANQKNYVYGLLFRLVKSGKLVKRGAKYRAAPISSPESETEAGGASVRH